ncbi:MAG TPA: 4-(cytidine 5'-diphospho)-2-C-methyl-D-erythritol kinase [Clostridiaceae bacterium]|nr:4-(cytidine 5'-diphospho)-2-C-methyl-D-erythritol kinase [Clostridiaceae bacterium]
MIELKARAKINLSIDVLRKLDNGYHEVRMVMQSIKLHDKIVLEPLKHGIEIVSDSSMIPLDEGNIAYKAAELIINRYSIKSGIRIILEKNIPVGAGLGGGSADAAAVLKGMNKIFSLNISQEELVLLGKKIGADVPFCINGGTMLAEGIGEKLTRLADLGEIPVVLVKPDITISTPWVYKNFNFDIIKDRPNTELIIKAINQGRIDLLAGNLKNVLESVTAEKFTEIKEIKNKLVEYGAQVSLMSGSGPTVFGLFEDMAKAENAYRKFKKEKCSCFLTETTNGES